MVATAIGSLIHRNNYWTLGVSYLACHVVEECGRWSMQKAGLVARDTIKGVKVFSVDDAIEAYFQTGAPVW